MLSIPHIHYRSRVRGQMQPTAIIDDGSYCVEEMHIPKRRLIKSQFQMEYLYCLLR
jgi:hypothetical protein